VSFDFVPHIDLFLIGFVAHFDSAEIRSKGGTTIAGGIKYQNAKIRSTWFKSKTLDEH
jgi:hypothetical protein